MPLTAAQKLLLFGGRSYSQKILNLFGSSIISYLPLWDSYSPVAGAGTITQALTAIVGVGTAFLTAVQIGDRLIAAGIDGYVTAIADDTHLTLSSSATVAVGVAYTITREVATDIGPLGLGGPYRNVTFGAAGIGDGRTAASFDGTTSFVNWYSAGLAAAFNNQEGTLMAWCKVSAAGVWTDAALRVIFQLGFDQGTNIVQALKLSTNNSLLIRYIAGGTISTATVAASDLGWFHVAITYSKSGDAVKVYYNGVQQGATLTGLGTWVGALSPNYCLLGSNSIVAALVWSGALAHGLVLNRAATPAEVAVAYVVP